MVNPNMSGSFVSQTDFYIHLQSCLVFWNWCGAVSVESNAVHADGLVPQHQGINSHTADRTWLCPQ